MKIMEGLKNGCGYPNPGWDCQDLGCAHNNDGTCSCLPIYNKECVDECGEGCTSGCKGNACLGCKYNPEDLY